MRCLDNSKYCGGKSEYRSYLVLDLSFMSQDLWVRMLANSENFQEKNKLVVEKRVLRWMNDDAQKRWCKEVISLKERRSENWLT